MVSENEKKFCINCGSNEFIKKSIDYIDYLEVEYGICCEKCGEQVNYWAYGFYENDKSDEYLKEEEKRKIISQREDKLITILKNKLFFLLLLIFI